MGKWVVAVTVLLLSLTVWCQETEFEANSFYSSANEYYKSGDYKNALKYAHRARSIYEDLGNSWGSKRSQNLIDDIEDVLSDRQLADTYYSIAGSYYLQGQSESNAYDLERAISMASLAKSQYELVGGTSGTTGALQAEDLMKKAQALLSDMSIECIREGDDLYQKAQNSFYAEEYVAAKDYALQANQKYLSCPYSPGIDKSAAQLSSINAKIESIRMQAKAAYDKAREYHAQNTEEGNSLCKQFSAESQRMYDSIGDEGGYSAATVLVSTCSEEFDNIREREIMQAEKYVNEAKALKIGLTLNPENCLNATEKADKALSIYQRFYNEAAIKEKDLPERSKVRTKLYATYLNEVKSLKSDIQDICGGITMRNIAETYYAKSQEFYLQNKLAESLSYADRALAICTQLKDYVCISKIDSFKALIDLRMQQLGEGDEYLEDAQNYYAVADFERALAAATKAKRLYDAISYESRSRSAADWLTNITEGVAKLDQANEHYSRAEGYMVSGKYGDALTQAEKANKLYVELNYTLGAERTREIMEESRDELDQASAQFRNTVIVIVVVLVVAGALIYQFMKRKRTMETEYAMKKKLEAEREKRKSEEWELRKDDETKNQVEEELRRLIEEERAKTGDENV